MKQAVILGGGAIPEEILLPEGAILLCADRGYAYAEQRGLRPKAVIGDFDSYGSIPKVPSSCTLLSHLPEKDDTDLWLACEYARELGCEKLFIYGAVGGRLDHTIANIQLLEHLVKAGITATLYGEGTIVTVQCKGKRDYPKNKGYFSIFSLTPECRGVTLCGVKYPLVHGTLRRDYPLGVSNEIVADYAEVSLDEGVLLLLQITE